MMRRFIRIVPIALLSLVVIALAYAFLWRGTASIHIASDYEYVAINGQTVDTQNNNQEIRLRPGKYQVEARGKTLEPFEAVISIMPMGATRLDISSQSIDMKRVVGHLIPNERAGQYLVKDGVFLEDNTWYVTSLIAPNGTPLDATFLLRYHNNEWQLYRSGTGFDTSGYIDTNIPLGVRQYLNEGGL